MRKRHWFNAALYSVALPEGTMIRRVVWVPMNVLIPNAGGVALSKVTLAKLLLCSNTLLPKRVIVAGMMMLVKPVRLNALSPMFVTPLLGMVTLVKLSQRSNALPPIWKVFVLGNTIDTMLCIPSGMKFHVTPVVKDPFVLLQLADRSSATFLPAVCSAGSSDCLKASFSPIVPKFISMGRNTGSAV
jgi:hypothetical protein